MGTKQLAERALEQGQGIVRLAPNWVPRSFCIPGRRIKLHPDDYYALGGERGGIDERWFSSTTPADNGPLTSQDEGLSFIVMQDGSTLGKVTLRDAVAALKGALIGDRLWDEHERWPMYSKFFDNQSALPHHIHHRDEHAKAVGQLGKPEAYYFPPQVNNHGGDFPYTFFGFHPHITRDQVRQCLSDFASGDNKITNISQAYRLEPGTGWDVPPGVLHAPGSMCTYEPQKASDVFAMYQSVIDNRQVVPGELLWKDTPEDKIGDVDYLMSVIDWELNVDMRFAEKHFMRPQPVKAVEEMEADGYVETWICYRSDAFSAKELTLLPGRTATITDAAAYGLIMMQGHGTMNQWKVDTPALIRYGQLTSDEFFVSESAARQGVKISNLSDTDPIVMLKHFGPENPDLTLE
ncbi:MAG: hypothetical protein HN742_41235 [Lentisphaerae bacterium]|jgi:hypothetical protein|nr:hypothetical protein [Lentisphaerota bacterium]MBT4820597.1 hypothetical protein [Lentisphaerota bacterium]MBT5608378.1 hypothetical protein [Lentisphaerota bacterium]MBT7060995.1 hypothetical protein [Lentisphaerota bacterium]MBT7848362.1 hypothetical protein [Lentisphaerota bacterium]